MRTLLTSKNCWAYSVAFETATNLGDSYLEIRLSCHIHRAIQNPHVLVIPVKEARTDEAIFRTVKDVLKQLVGDSHVLAIPMKEAHTGEAILRTVQDVLNKW